jgi:hypothetical protein
MSVVLAAVAILALLALAFEKRQNGVREREWALERGALLQRIQAPEQAVREHSLTPAPSAPLPIAADDDARWAERHEERLNSGAS